MIGSHVKWKGQWNGLLGKWTDSRDYPVGPFVLPGLQGYYDTSDTSSLVYDSAGRVSLLMDKSGNSQATCFVSNVAASNSLSAPTKSVLGNQLFSLDVGLDDYTPGSDVTIASKLSGNDGFAIQVLTTGVVRLRIGDGVSVTNVDSTASLSIADMVRGTIGIIWADGLGASFTQNGATLGVPVAAVKTLTNAAVAMTVGTITGRIYRFTALGFYDCNPAGATRGSTSFASGGDTWTLATSGATGARISGERDFYQGTVANQPIYLPWGGTNYGYLNGTAANYFSTPDSASFPTGDIDIRYFGSLDDWTPATAQALVSKDAGGSNRTCVLSILIGGLPNFYISVDGTATSSATASTLPVGAVNGMDYGIRVTRASATGTVTFYTSLDGENWTQLGTTQPTTSGALFDGTSELWVGKRVSVSDSISGRPKRVRVYNGINGTAVFDFAASRYVSGPTFTASTGEVWTVNGGALIVVRTGLYGDGSNDYLKSAMFVLAQPETACLVASQVGWTSGDYVFDGNAANGGALIQTTSTPRVNLNAGSSVAGNTDWLAKTVAAVFALFNGASSTLGINRVARTTGNAGAGVMNGFTLFANGSGSSNGNVFVSEVAVYSTAISPASQDAIALYEGRKWRFTV